jgi:acyl carrier protein
LIAGTRRVRGAAGFGGGKQGGQHVSEKAEKTENENVSIEDKVIGIVASQLDVEKEKIKPETSFINDLGADSLDIVELVMEFEEAFDMSIPDEDAEKIRTVGDAINYIKEHQG